MLHGLFRRECVLHTPLFAGFPGFRSKLWLSDTTTGIYRGMYQWDGPDRAVTYAETLARLLRPVCVPGSVRYRVVPGVVRDDFLRDPDAAGAVGRGTEDAWWLLDRPVAPQPQASVRA